jgi:hypothetical protein
LRIGLLMCASMRIGAGMVASKSIASVRAEPARGSIGGQIGTLGVPRALF